MSMYGSGSGGFSGSNSMGEYSGGYGQDTGINPTIPEAYAAPFYDARNPYSSTFQPTSDMDGGQAGNRLIQQQQQQFAQPQMSPLQLMAQQQAQMDMNGGGQWGQYSSPQMNPMQTYDSSGWQPPFQFGQFFGGK
jgi:hypothetical protein